MKPKQWRVTAHHSTFSQVEIVTGWKGIRAIITSAKKNQVRYVDVGPKIGPYLARFVFQQDGAANETITSN